MTLSQRLAEYLVSTDWQDLPRAVEDQAVSCVYNYMGCVYAGTLEAPPRTILAMRERWFPAGRCHILGTGLTADPCTAALVNGTAGNALGYDDMYREGIYHPGVPIISAALAAAELEPVTGREFLTAVVLGYEISDRLARMMQPSHYRYWHTTATAGAFGAVAAASKILKLSAEETVHAFGAAGTQAAGLQECTGNMNQRFHLGAAARNGLLGALLARCGYQSAPGILDGAAGYITAMSDYRGDMAAPFADLGETWLILETMFKFYPCCAHIHASIDAALGALAQSGAGPEAVERIEIGTYQTAITNSGNPHPRDTQEAKFSIPYCIAAAAAKGRLTMGEFAAWPPEPEVAALMKKVELRVDPDLEAAFHRGMQGGMATVHTAKGSFTEVRPYRKGDPEAPLTREELSVKFRSLCSLVLPPEGVAELERRIYALPELEDASVLAKPLG